MTNSRSRGGYNLPSLSFTAKNCMTKSEKKFPISIASSNPTTAQEYADSWPNETDGTLSKEEWGFSLDFDLDSMCDVMIQSLRQ